VPATCPKARGAGAFSGIACRKSMRMTASGRLAVASKMTLTDDPAGEYQPVAARQDLGRGQT
jgi:hypothetical protein